MGDFLSSVNAFDFAARAFLDRLAFSGIIDARFLHCLHAFLVSTDAIFYLFAFKEAMLNFVIDEIDADANSGYHHNYNYVMQQFTCCFALMINVHNPIMSRFDKKHKQNRGGILTK